MSKQENDQDQWFMWVWLALGVGIIGFNLWSAFSPRGSIQTITSEEAEPRAKFGHVIEPDERPQPKSGPG